MSTDRTSSGGGRRRRAAWTVAALLPMALAAVVLPYAVGPHAHAGSGHGRWAAQLWRGSGNAGVTGTTLSDVRTAINAAAGPAAALDGRGIGIALVDTGVAPVPGIPAAQVVNGPDLSFESQSPNLRYLDTYGHGTHMAGIIIGNDTATGTVGLAPKAKLTSIKMGTANGAVDVTQMIAAIDWVVAHRNDDPSHPIRVINLSYGSGGTSPFWTDPLGYAVERAWAAGIVVVVAAGNDGSQPDTLANPATDQWVVAVGSIGLQNTPANQADDVMSSFSETSYSRNVDILAPGESILSLADPGSNIDQTYPSARVGTTLFRGSGTSQAAAVTSAAVALILQSRPWLNPDQVKSLLIGQGTLMRTGWAASMGLKQLNVGAALSPNPSYQQQTWIRSSGTATLDSARGPSRVMRENVALAGEASVWGPLNMSQWTQRSTSNSVWQGGSWMGFKVAGDGWTGTSWASRTWGAAAWEGGPWGGTTWHDPDWEGRYWSGRYWSGRYWSGRYWSSDTWASVRWG